MPKLPILSGKEIIKILEMFGFIQIRQKGSHVSLRKKELNGTRGCVVPLHKEVAIGTLKSVLRQTGITDEDFINKMEQ